jgi:pimeloyl-ACP methyl ester carboxylesterase
MPGMPHVIYLHGFGSGPQSEKGTALGRDLAGHCTSYAIPALDGGDFRGMTMPSLRDRALAAIAALPADGRPLLVVGSSLGGYLATWIAADRLAPRIGACLLIAPAFGFARRAAERLGPDAVAAWRKQGELPFYHQAAGGDRPVGVGFLDSCLGLPEVPGDPGVPTVLVQGRQDGTVDPAGSLAWAAAHPAVELHLVEGDHALTAPRHREMIAWCARDLLRRMSPAGPT